MRLLATLGIAAALRGLASGEEWSRPEPPLPVPLVRTHRPTCPFRVTVVDETRPTVSVTVTVYYVLWTYEDAAEWLPGLSRAAWDFMLTSPALPDDTHQPYDRDGCYHVTITVLPRA